MKKMLLAMVLVFVMAFVVPAFAGSGGGDGDATATIEMTNNGAGGSILSPIGNSGTIQGGSVGAITNTANGGAGGSVIGSGNSAVGNGLGNFSPEAKATVGPISNSQQQGMLNNNAGTLLSPSATGGSATVKDVGNVSIGGGFLSKTLSPEASASANVKNDNVNVGIVAPDITNVNVNKPEFNNKNVVVTDINNKVKVDTTDVNINKNVIEKGAVKNDNVNIQGQKQDQKQKQQQGQAQGQQQKMNNDQTIAPVQTTDIVIEAPKQNLLGLPSQSVPEMNFGNGKMLDATSKLPNFAIYGIKPLKDEAIMEVISIAANIKFKNLYKKVLDDAKSICALPRTVQSGANIRYQIIRAEAQKSWSTGGNIGGGGSGLASNGLGAGSGAGSLIPSWGGTKADDLFTVIFVKVVL